jgi:hypothetical protein
MERPARFFNCARCREQVVICSDCDRGNIYCNQACSKSARKESLCEAGRRYQNTRHGRHKHAERQRRYRARQREKQKKVTHHTYPDLPPPDLLPLGPKPPAGSLAQPDNHDISCHFCGRCCSSFLRVDFLRRSERGQERSVSSWPLGP